MAGLWGSAAFLNATLQSHHGISERLNVVALIFTLLLSLCAVLGLRAWINAPWIEILCLAALAPGALMQLRQLFMALQSSKTVTTLAALAGLVVLLDLLYASLPLCLI